MRTPLGVVPPPARQRNRAAVLPDREAASPLAEAGIDSPLHVGCALRDGLREEGADPLEQERPVVTGCGPRPAGYAFDRAKGAQAVDPLCHPPASSDLRPFFPNGGEALDLRCSSRDPGELDTRGVEAFAESSQGAEACRPPEDEVVRWRSERAADGATPALDDPERYSS
jgi:hypothetical protein